MQCESGLTLPSSSHRDPLLTSRHSVGISLAQPWGHPLVSARTAGVRTEVAITQDELWRRPNTSWDIPRLSAWALASRGLCCSWKGVLLKRNQPRTWLAAF